MGTGLAALPFLHQRRRGAMGSELSERVPPLLRTRLDGALRRPARQSDLFPKTSFSYEFHERGHTKAFGVLAVRKRGSIVGTGRNDGNDGAPSKTIGSSTKMRAS